MDIRKLAVIPVLAAALAIGACADEEDPVDTLPEPGPTPAETGVAPVVEPAVAPAAPDAVAEIAGNGIDDDGDGLVDEP